MMYKCVLPKHLSVEGEEPREVILRMYGQIIQENPETVVTDSVIFGLLAEKNLGPGLHGVFTGGRVEEYVQVLWLCPILLFKCRMKSVINEEHSNVCECCPLACWLISCYYFH